MTRILFVCMGNICRSPTAEAVFISLLKRSELKNIEADSAGTHSYHIGEPPDPRTQRVAASHGIDMSGLRARLLSRQDFERFDWVLVMDGQNRDAALEVAPPKFRHKVRLLLDFAPAQPLREVPDPYYGKLSDFEQVFDLTQQAADGLLQFLRKDAADTTARSLGKVE